MKCEASTLGHFLYRVAMCGFRYHYYRYAVIDIPEGKDLAATDKKLMQVYGVVRCRMKRFRQRQQGFASTQYVRFGHSFILMATEGEHSAFSNLKNYDVRTSPLHFHRYSIGLRGSTVSVEVEKRVWIAVERKVQRLALHDRALIEARMSTLPFYRFSGVEKQKTDLMRKINRRRKTAGLPLVLPHPSAQACRYQDTSGIAV